jgi:hypothetical protein
VPKVAVARPFGKRNPRDELGSNPAALFHFFSGKRPCVRRFSGRFTKGHVSITRGFINAWSSARM